MSHESIRRWCVRFGAEIAARLRKRRPKPGDGIVTLKLAGERQAAGRGWRHDDQA